MRRRIFLFSAFFGSSLAAAGAGEADEARAKVAELGGQVLEIAQNDDRLEVLFRSADGLKDADLAVLTELPKLAFLRLGGASVGDEALAHIGKLGALVKLDLSRTKVTDDGVRRLSGLAKLEYLNLYGTAITDEGLEHLAGLSALKNLYLWQTQVTDEGVEKLQKALPELKIDRGWELPEEPAGDSEAEEPK